MSTYIVREKQTIFDVCLQHFGSLENLFDMLRDNGLSITSSLKSGQKLQINSAGIGDELIKKTVSIRNLIFVNDQQAEPPISGGDYNRDYNNDYY